MRKALLGSPARAADRAGLFVQRWQSGNVAVYLMGANAFTKTVADFARRNGLEIAGLVTTGVSDSHWYGMERCELSVAPPDAVVINCVPDGRTITLQKQIRRANLQPLTYFELSAWSAKEFPLSFVTPPFEPGDEARCAWVMDHLDDEYSRETYARVLDFRSSLDVSPLAYFPFDIAGQYVESFLRPMAYSHLVDGGVYDGKNTLTLLDAYPELRSATLLEPNLAMHPIIAETLVGRDYRLIGKGLWDTDGELRFNSNSGPASGIDPSGDDVIQVTHVDALELPSDVWIKLDLEGAELAALRGASDTICTKRPGLAVAAYHDNRHLFEIPEFVFKLRSDYRLKVRHYTEGRLETIFYFL